MFYLLWNE